MVGVRVDVSLSAVLGSSPATNPAAVKPIHDSFRIKVPPHFMCAQIPFTRHAIDRGEKRAVPMGGWRCRL
jgi:hypothetical protein